MSIKSKWLDFRRSLWRIEDERLQHDIEDAPKLDTFVSLPVVESTLSEEERWKDDIIAAINREMLKELNEEVDRVLAVWNFSKLFEDWSYR